MDKIITTITSKEGKFIDVYTLTETELKNRWERGQESGESSILLSKLKPQIEHTSSRPAGTRQLFISGLVLIVIAVVIYFSALQPLAPLLSPAIAVFAAVQLFRAFKNRKIEHYSTFRCKDETSFSHLILSQCNPQELEQFEAAFEDQCAVAQFSRD